MTRRKHRLPMSAPMIQATRREIDQLAPLVIDGSADLGDVKVVELMLLVVELYERGESNAASEVGAELDGRMENNDIWLEACHGPFVAALEDEARVAG